MGSYLKIEDRKDNYYSAEMGYMADELNVNQDLLCDDFGELIFYTGGNYPEGHSQVFKPVPEVLIILKREQERLDKMTEKDCFESGFNFAPEAFKDELKELIEELEKTPKRREITFRIG